MAQQIIDTGTGLGDGSGDDVYIALNKSNDNFTELYLRNYTTGGAQYVDSVYTSASPLIVNSGAGKVALTNNKSVVIDNNIPSEFTSGMWDSDKLIGVNNKDIFSTEVRFKAKSSNVNGMFEVSLDIGGAIGEIRNESKIFYKSANTEQSFAFVMNYFTGATFISNGCQILIESLTGNTSIYDIEILPTRTHKGY